MKELLIELQAIRLLSERLALEIERLGHHLDRAERQLRARGAPLIVTGGYRDDEDGGD